MRVGDVLPFEELYLIRCDGQWPVRADINETHAISTIENMTGQNRVRVWRVTSIEVEELELQTEVVRESLVPYGTSVKE